MAKTAGATFEDAHSDEAVRRIKLSLANAAEILVIKTKRLGNLSTPLRESCSETAILAEKCEEAAGEI